MIISLLKNQNQPGIKYKIAKFNGGIQPPRKRQTVKLDISKIEEYSAKKNKTKPTAEYSTLYPETSSDSASGKSKGTRLVSAKMDIKNKTKEGNKGIINGVVACDETIAVKFADSANNNTGIIIKPIATS